MSKQPDAIFAQVRKQSIIDTVNADGIVTVAELCSRFNVSPATIRSDLRELETAGLLERTHGGAISCAKANYEPTTYQKEVQHVAEKRAIAKEALTHIHPGDTIALDTGTTTFQLAKLLTGFDNLTVVTYDLQIAAWLEANTNIYIIMAGGAVRRHFHCTAGQTAFDTISKLHVDKVFAAVNGVTERGLSTPNIDMANIKSALIGCADKVILLADSSKAGHDAFVNFAPLDRVDVFITDDGVDTELAASMQATGIEVVAVKPDGK